MALQINDTAPDFEADTTAGRIRFYDWVGDSWCVIFSHPKDFTPVCTTELGYMAKIKPEFDKRNCKILGLSVDSVDDHKRWSKDIEEAMGQAPNYPMIGDGELKIAKLYGMLPASAGDTAAGRTPADNATVRNVYIIGPDKKIKLVISYPMSTGRNFAEILRALDSLQLTAKHQVATPVNWQDGDDVIIVPSVSDEAAKAKYPGRLEVAQALHADRAAAARLNRRRPAGATGVRAPLVILLRSAAGQDPARRAACAPLPLVDQITRTSACRFLPADNLSARSTRRSGPTTRPSSSTRASFRRAPPPRIRRRASLFDVARPLRWNRSTTLRPAPNSPRSISTVCSGPSR